MVSDLIIFDCDGVMIDSELIACRVSAACLSEIGIPITVEEIVERYVGISATAMFADLAARAGTPVPVGFAEIVQRRLMRSFESELVAMPGIGAALLAINSPVCVASSSAPERLWYSLSLVGLLSRPPIAQRIRRFVFALSGRPFGDHAKSACETRSFHSAPQGGTVAAAICPVHFELLQRGIERTQPVPENIRSAATYHLADKPTRLAVCRTISLIDTPCSASARIAVFSSSRRNQPKCWRRSAQVRLSDRQH